MPRNKKAAPSAPASRAAQNTGKTTAEQATAKAVAKVRGPALEVMSKFEEQVANLEKLAEEYLDQGLIGSHVEASKLKDQAEQSLKEARKKLGLALDVRGADPEPKPRPAKPSAQRQEVAPPSKTEETMRGPPKPLAAMLPVDQECRQSASSAASVGSADAPVVTAATSPLSASASACAHGEDERKTVEAFSAEVAAKRSARRWPPASPHQASEWLQQIHAEKSEAVALEEFVAAAALKDEERRLQQWCTEREKASCANDLEDTEPWCLPVAGESSTCSPADALDGLDGLNCLDGWPPPTPASSSCEGPPKYRWKHCQTERGTAVCGPAVLEVAPGIHHGDVDIDVAEGSIRLAWRSCPPSATTDDAVDTVVTLFTPFRVDEAAASVRRKKREGGLLVLTLPFLCPRVPAAPALADALRGPEGHGVVDGFMAAQDADQVRQRLLELWRRGEFQPGEVEGDAEHHGDKKGAPRSDKYVYTEDGDDTLLLFTRKLDALVLQLSKDVPALRGVQLMRGRPMAAVYSGEGSRYTPHFDAVGGDNGRVLTCIMYLNPFWRPGDGAELKLWPEARYLERKGVCREVQPLHGRLAVFLCDSRNLHEVCPVAAGRRVEPRMAISCWYYNSEAIPRVAGEQRAKDSPI